MNNSKETRVIQTISGPITIDAIQNLALCLAREYLSPETKGEPSGKEVTLENLRYHVRQPNSMQNLTITPSSIEHEVQWLLNQGQCNSKQILLLDQSHYSKAVPEIFKRYTVAKGYQYYSEESVFSTRDFVLKQLKYEFQLGNSYFKPAFIGEVLLSDFFEGNNLLSTKIGILQAYLEFAAKTKCPIFVNCHSIPFPTWLSYLTSQNNPIQLSYLLQKLNQIVSLLQKAKEFLADEHILLFNFPFLFQEKQTHDDGLLIVNSSSQTMRKIRNDFKCTLGFDLLRYERSKLSMLAIANQINTFPEKTTLSSGVRSKTDLQAYSGSGLQLYSKQPCFQLFGISQKQLRQVTFDNYLERLNWQIVVEEIKEVKYWKCDSCLQEFDESVEVFRKCGKQFCSIKCLKHYKF